MELEAAAPPQASVLGRVLEVLRLERVAPKEASVRRLALVLRLGAIVHETKISSRLKADLPSMTAINISKGEQPFALPGSDLQAENQTDRATAGP